jgi:hypothetical protein
MPKGKGRIVLKHAWYLITHVTFFDSTPRAPQLAALDELFEAGTSPARTAAAVEVMLRVAEHLSDAVRHGRHADGDQFARLLHGVNLLIGHLAQTSGRLAYQVDTGTAPTCRPCRQATAPN